MALTVPTAHALRRTTVLPSSTSIGSSGVAMPGEDVLLLKGPLDQSKCGIHPQKALLGRID
jgi:hypothetical protein